MVRGGDQRRQSCDPRAVHVHTRLEHQTDCLEIVPGRRGGQDGVLERILRLDVRAAGDQQAYDLDGGVAHRGEEQRGVSRFARQVHVRAGVEQQLHLLDLSNRHHQRGGPEPVLRVDVGSLCDQPLHRIDRAGRRGRHERRVAELAGGVGLCARMDKRVDAGQIVAADRLIQRVSRKHAGRRPQQHGPDGDHDTQPAESPSHNSPSGTRTLTRKLDLEQRKCLGLQLRRAGAVVDMRLTLRPVYWIFQR